MADLLSRGKEKAAELKAVAKEKLEVLDAKYEGAKSAALGKVDGAKARAPMREPEPEPEPAQHHEQAQRRGQDPGQEQGQEQAPGRAQEPAPAAGRRAPGVNDLDADLLRQVLVGYPTEQLLVHAAVRRALRVEFLALVFRK
jgi:hypothetical protein